MDTRLHFARLIGRAALALTTLACLSVPTQADTGANDWVAQQVVVGTDGASRVLWTNNSPSTGGQVVGIWNFNTSDTKSSNGPVYGPYTDSNGAWVAKQLAVAPDGTLRLLWTNDSVTGQEIVVWKLDAGGSVTNIGTVYGPLSDTNGKWFVRDMQIAPDGTERLLWTNFGSGGVEGAVWTVSAVGVRTATGATYGPYTGMYPQQLAVASDSTARLLWTTYGTTSSGAYTGDTIVVWTMSASGVKTTVGTSYGPYSGWAVNNFDLNTTDNTMRVLWYNTSSSVAGEAAGVWVLDAAGNQKTVGSTYGPFAGWSAVGLTALKDGTSRVQWQRNTTSYRSGGDTFGYWGFDSSGKQSFVGSSYGSYSGWTLGSFGFNTGDNTFRLLWNRSDDAAGLWSLDAAGGQSILGATYGPFAY